MTMRVFFSAILLFAVQINVGETAELPLHKVVLFNAGLGYFEHQQQIDGSVELQLTFDQGDINDLLKSLVVQDMGDGHVNSINYPSRWPVSDQLKSFSVDLTSQPTLAELLHQIRGEKVKLDNGTIVGTIVGVELKPQQIDQQVLNREVLNLLTDAGLRGIPLDSIGTVELVNKALDAELREVLKLLVAHRSVDKKTVRFSFTGIGNRTVRIGYIRQTPIWKTSYRVVLDEGKPSLLQGWAIVENTGEADWSNIDLTLTSGRPVTFQMDLYRPLLVERPTELPSVPPSLASRIHSPELGELDMDYPLAQRPFATSQIPIIGPQGSMGMGGGMGGGGMGGGMGGGGGMGMGGMGGDMGMGSSSGGGQAPIDPTQGVVAQASAAEVGEQFQYKIDNPVSLARRSSALIPIVDQNVETEKLSIFTTGTDDLHPMLAFRMTNTTDLRLTGGPITVFEDGAYAGDAKISFLRPGEKRLISYAQDVDLHVRYSQTSEKKNVRQASVDLGTVKIQYDLHRSHRYRVQNKSNKMRKMMLERLRADDGWRIVDKQIVAETTDSHYRYNVEVPAGSTIEVVVAEQRTDQEQFDLQKIDEKAIEQLAHRKDLPENVIAVVKQIRQLKVAIADLDSTLELQQQLLTDITKEQSRIRSNMSSLDRDSDLYRRYVTKLTDQEDKFDAARDRIVQLRTNLAETRRLLSRFFPSSEKEDVKPVPRAADPFKDPFGDDSPHPAATDDPFGQPNDN